LNVGLNGEISLCVLISDNVYRFSKKQRLERSVQQIILYSEQKVLYVTF
jgi:hypothetical protein